MSRDRLYSAGFVEPDVLVELGGQGGLKVVAEQFNRITPDANRRDGAVIRAKSELIASAAILSASASCGKHNERRKWP